MSLREAIESYHKLLTDELAGESFQQLEEQQRRRGLFFGGRPLCSVLRPRFLTREQYHFLQSRMHLLLQAFDKVYVAALADKDFRSQFGLLDWEEELVQYSPGFRDPSPTSRIDTFFVTERGGLRLTVLASRPGHSGWRRCRACSPRPRRARWRRSACRRTRRCRGRTSARA